MCFRDSDGDSFGVGVEWGIDLGIYLATVLALEMFSEMLLALKIVGEIAYMLAVFWLDSEIPGSISGVHFWGGSGVWFGIY